MEKQPWVTMEAAPAQVRPCARQQSLMMGKGFQISWDHSISAPFPSLERAGVHKQRFPRRAGCCSFFTVEGSALEPAAAQMAVLLHGWLHYKVQLIFFLPILICLNRSNGFIHFKSNLMVEWDRLRRFLNNRDISALIKLSDFSSSGWQKQNQDQISYFKAGKWTEKRPADPTCRGSGMGPRRSI